MGIEKILVANRGEIARRVFRTCRELGISTVAVFSDPDATEPHAREAVESIHLQGTTPADTYLDLEKILAAAKETGADAIHPGYGFLSENAAFAEAVEEAGITWIGPPPSAIKVMGSKIESKEMVTDAGVPTLPTVPLKGLSTVGTAALAIGFPILVKASGGGGGKGMRVVDEPDDLLEAVKAAKREAASAFGDDRVFLEKYLLSARHIEIQVFADQHDNVVSLYERECSIQRRHQKIIEESPSTALSAEKREEMGKAAADVARTVGYVGAGTVEFMVDGDDFYFLEMNTRLQVEHPVTEMVTGLDLVALQIRVAEGEPLPPEASSPRLQGHAIEARLYAEDPANDFLPVTGPIRRFEFAESPGLRVDSGVAGGSEVTVYYDPMMAKVIAHSETRESATSKLADALRGATVHGPTNNIPLLVRILESEEFASGDTTTRFLEGKDMASLSLPLVDQLDEERCAVAAAVADAVERREKAPVLATIPSGWRNLRSQPNRVSYRGHHQEHGVEYVIQAGHVVIEGHTGLEVADMSPEKVTFVADGSREGFRVARYGSTRFVNTSRGQARLELAPRFPMRSLEDDEGSLHAPMPGKILRLDVAPGETVEEGQVMLVLEAMKMEHTLRAPHAGQVSEVLCREGDQVESGAVLVVLA